MLYSTIKNRFAVALDWKIWNSVLLEHSMNGLTVHKIGGQLVRGFPYIV